MQLSGLHHLVQLYSIVYKCCSLVWVWQTTRRQTECWLCCNYVGWRLCIMC